MITTYQIGQTGRSMPSMRTILSVPCDGTDLSTSFVDGAGHPLTAHGNACISTTQFYSGGSSMKLDGSGDYVTTPDHADFNVGASNFKIAMRIYIASFAAINGLLSKRASTGVFSPFNLYVDTDGKVKFLGSYSGSVWDVNIASTAAISLNTWADVEFFRLDGGFRLRVDSAIYGSGSTSNALMTNATNLTIGAGAADGTFSSNGYIDEIHMARA